MEVSMNPVIPNPLFSHDAEKYVYQVPDVQFVNRGTPPVKPFKVKKSTKTQKDVEKKKKQGDRF
jgi:hypothetical protein